VLANDDTVGRVRYLVVIAPGDTAPDVRYRGLETDSELAIGDALWLDERLMRVSAIGEGPESYDSTVIVTAALEDRS
jgi:hypothetical protein